MATTALEISVRPTRPDDLGAITRIYGYYVSYSLATFEIDPPPLAEMLRRFELLMAGGYPYFVAVANHAVLGYAYAGPHHARAGYRHTVENSVYVDHAQTGRGIGSLLLDALIGESESRGFRQMVAIIGDSANRASIRLHERCGFRPVGTFRAVGHKHGRWVDTMLMQRALGAGDAPI